MSAMVDEAPVLRHYTQRLAANPDWMALSVALVSRRDQLVRKLTGPQSDKADAATLHALRGQIHAYNEILATPESEARRHEEAKRT